MAPTFLDKFNSWHTDSPPPPPPPPISQRAAFLLLAVYALSYFLPFYFSPRTRPSPTLHRDAPSVIRARVASVLLSCLACSACTYLILVRATIADALHLMGVWPLGLAGAARCLLLTAFLFAGPLFERLVIGAGWRLWVGGRVPAPLRAVWEEWTAWRNYVAGPITEELIFRSASVPLLLAAACPPWKVVFLSPFVFGLSHAHHYYEFRLVYPRVPATAALARSALQLAYTTLFGAYATFVFVRSGSLVAACAVHAFCNAVGLPRVWGRVCVAGGEDADDDDYDGDEYEDGNGNDEGRDGGAERADRLLGKVKVDLPRPGRLGGGAVGRRRGGGRPPSSSTRRWTAAYYLVLVAGALLWWRSLWPLTESGNALIPASAFTGAEKPT